MARLTVRKGNRTTPIHKKAEEPAQEVVVQREESLPFISHTVLNTEPVEFVYVPEIKEVIVEKIIELPGQVVYEKVEVPVEVIIEKEVIVEKPVYVEVIREVISYDNARIEALEKELSNVYELKRTQESINKKLKIALVITYAVVIMGVLLV